VQVKVGIRKENTMPPFQSQVVIITGASSGIGRALAVALAKQQARLVLAARSLPGLEETAALCRPFTQDILIVPTDVTELVQCETLIRRAMEAFGRIDMLVNNAGVSQWAYFEEITDLSLFEKLMRVNYLSCVYTTYFALPHLKQTRGRIVAVSSLAGLAGIPTRTGYSASKHAIVGFYEALRTEIGETGISVTLVFPGFVTSAMRLNAFGPDGKPLGHSPVKETEVMSAEECAHLILDATARRRRKLVMTLRGKLGQWLKLIAPKLVDKIALKGIREGK
jgi:NAD(P)-dependent dehydrogenase (short-subunit alcohol dehydrogenase family)